MDFAEAISPVWPKWRKVLFRFFAIYLILQIAPWTWLSPLPGLAFTTDIHTVIDEWLVNFANKNIFHIKDVLVPLNGSGDTSFGWAQFCTYLLIAFIGCFIWTILDRKNTHYIRADYWLRTFLRYYIASVSFTYGIIKIFATQMIFPNISQLATPLGDFLPMRLSWLFIGYSTPYQVFSGIMETVAGTLLLYRRTVSLGLIIATGVFINVMMLNLAYDIPVKIFSMHIVMYCIFLLAHDARRLTRFFILNESTTSSTAYEMRLSRPWMRYAYIGAKLLFISLSVGYTAYDSWTYYKDNQAITKTPIKPGLYDVKLFVLNKRDTITQISSENNYWKDMVFEAGTFGSVNSTDTLFRQRYGRGYFTYEADTISQVLKMKKFNSDSLAFMTMRYHLSDSNTVKLWTTFRNDSLYIELGRSKKHFQLTEKQFHWLSEANR